MELRPHVLSWEEPGGGELDPDTGLPVPDSGQTVSQPCRFVAGGGRTFKNQDSEEVMQRGRIRVNLGAVVPQVFQEVRVTEGDRELFRGQVMEVYTGGHLTGWRIDV